MPADLSWIDGSVEDAAKLIADRAVASRALGGAVAPGETPAWARDLEKAAAEAEKQADGIVDTVTGWGNQARDWAGEQIRSAVGDQVGSAVRDVTGSPGVRGALTGGLIGAGGGAVLGLGANLLSSNKRKRPLSNALFGGLLGGLGGAAVGGLAGTVGGGGPARPTNSAKLDENLRNRDTERRDAPHHSIEKTVSGLNHLSGAGLARGAGYGALAGTAPELVGRAALRGLNPTTQTQHVGANSVRAHLSPAQQAGLAGPGVAGVRRPPTDAVRTAIGGNFDTIRKTFLNSKNPVLAGVHGVGDDALARALTRGVSASVPVTPAFRPAPITWGTARRGAIGAVLGTVGSGAFNGVSRATGDEARLTYLRDQVNDLRALFPHIGAAGDATAADPKAVELRTALARAAERLNGSQTRPLEAPEIAGMERLLQGLGQGDEAHSLHNRFRNLELGRPAGGPR